MRNSRRAGFWIFLVLPLLLRAGTAQETKGSVPPPPEDVRGIVEAKIIEHTGADFFHENVRFMPQQSRYYEAFPDCVTGRARCADYLKMPHYLLIWRYTIPGTPAVDLAIEAHVDVNGRPVIDDYVSYIPTCAATPRLCSDFLAEADARALARAQGLGEGIRPWRVNFFWNREEPGCFVWQFHNTLADSGDAQEGEVMRISATTGEVVQHSGYFIN